MRYIGFAGLPFLPFVGTFGEVIGLNNLVYLCWLKI